MEKIVVCALYKFVILDNYRELKIPLLEFMLKHAVYGTLLLAHEGINGTVSRLRTEVDALLEYIKMIIV